MPLSRNRTLSPLLAFLTSSSSIAKDWTSTTTELGIIIHFWPTLSEPASSLPATMVPISLYFSMTGRRKGRLLFRDSLVMVSRSSTSEGPSYQLQTAEPARSTRLAPV
eukprot:Lithocolla_globosa_v1_NODE_2868_length_1841_cov_741.629899.p6 type:complete len:108 gc:universal NODE_2868_length_1841_cov_741.629899:1400-1077(-)